MYSAFRDLHIFPDTFFTNYNVLSGDENMGESFYRLQCFNEELEIKNLISERGGNSKFIRR